MEIQKQLYQGTWFAIEGKKDHVRKIDKSTIDEACKSIFDSLRTETPINEVFLTKNVTVRLLGIRSKQPRSFLQTILSIIKRIFSWKKKSSPAEREKQKTALQSSMHLFDIEDKTLLSEMSITTKQNLEKNLPSNFSNLLHAWASSQGIDEGPSEEAITSLDRYQKSLEEIFSLDQQAEKETKLLAALPSAPKASFVKIILMFFQNRKLNSIYKKIAQKRAQLQTLILKKLQEAKTHENRVVYIPSGVQENDGENIPPTLYELRYDKSKEQYSVRSLDFHRMIKQPDEPVTSEETRNQFLPQGSAFLTEDLLDDFVKTAIQGGSDQEENALTEQTDEALQQPPAQIQSSQESKSISLKSKTGERKVLSFSSQTNTPLLKKPKNPAHYSRIAFRAIFQESYTQKKLEAQTSNFLSSWENAPKEQKRNVHFRSWIAEVGKKLLITLNKAKHPNISIQLEPQVKRILEQIEQLDQKQKIELPESSLRKPVQHAPSIVLHPEIPHLSLSSIQPRIVTSASFTPIALESLLSNPADCSGFQQHLAFLEQQATQGKFELLHLQLKKDFLVLERFFSDAANVTALANGGKRDEWIEAMKSMNFFLIRSAFGLHRTTPLLEDVHFYLLGLKFQDQLIRASDELRDDPYVKKFVIDTRPIESVLDDPYISHDDAIGIASSLRYFRNIRKEDNDDKRKIWICGFLTNIEHSSFPCALGDHEFFVEYEKRQLSLPSESLSFRHPDLSTKEIEPNQSVCLPRYMIHLRQSSIMLHAFLNPSQALLPGIVACDVRLPLNIPGPLPNSVKAKGLQACQKPGPLHFQVHETSPRDGSRPMSDFIHISPWNTAIFPLDVQYVTDSKGIGYDHFAYEGRDNPPSLFEEQGVSLDPVLKKRCFEQTIFAELTYLLAGEKMLRMFSDSPLESSVPIEKKDEWDVLCDTSELMGLSSDCSHDLQLMQLQTKNRYVYGHRNHLHTTLSFIVKHGEVLDSPIYGAQIARLIERNFFHGGAFLLIEDVPFQKFILETLLSSIQKAIELQHENTALRLLQLINSLLQALPKEETEEYRKTIATLLLDETFSKNAEKKNSREFWLTKLLVYEKQEEVSLQDIALAFFNFRASPPSSSLDPIKEKKACDLYYQTVSTLLKNMNQEEKNSFCSNICKAVHKEVPSDTWQSNDDGSIFTNGSLQVDYTRGEVWDRGRQIVQLPPAITQQPLFSTLKRFLIEADSSYNTNHEWIVTPVTIPQEALQYETTVGKVSFRLLAASDGTLRLYRKRVSDTQWSQFHKIVQTTQETSLPSFLSTLDCWITDDGKTLVAEKQNVAIWKGKLSQTNGALSLESLERVAPQQEATLHSIEGSSSFNPFLSIEQSSSVLALSKQKNQLVDTIEYTRLDRPYSFSWKNGKWMSQQYTEYHLSKKSLERYAHSSQFHDDVSCNLPTEQGLIHLHRLFHPSFTNYHLLESTKNQPALLVVSGVSYIKDTTSAQKELSYRFSPEYGDEATIPSYVFEIDPIKGLIVKQPKEREEEAYGYLAYLTLIQGNFKDGMAYLQKTYAHEAPTEQTKKILRWIHTYLDTQPHSSERTLIEARLFLLDQQTLDEKTKTFSNQEGHQRAVQAKRLYDAIPLDRQPTLSQDECDELEIIAHSSWYSLLQQPEINDDLNRIINGEPPHNETLLSHFHITQAELQELQKQAFINERGEPEGALFEALLSGQHNLESSIQASDIRQKYVLQAKMKEREALIEERTQQNEQLKKEIAAREKALEEQSSPDEKPESTTPLFEQQHWNDYFTSQAQSEQREILSLRESAQLTGLYEKTLFDGLRRDLETYKQQIAEQHILSPKKKEQFAANLQKQLEEKTKQTNRLRAQILASSKEIVSTLAALNRVGRATSDELFDTLIRYYGENNGLPNQRELSEQIRQYLVAAIQARQLKNASTILSQLIPHTEEYQQRCTELYSLLNTQWQYDIESDPHAASFLLIEYELGIVCRRSQLEVVRENIKKTNCFKQEICGGGKTTVLRNIISHIRADGATLSGVSTLAPLRGEHGLLYTRTTRKAFGEKVFEFHCNRNSPSDQLSLLTLYNNLLKTTLFRGRLDLSKGDVQSFGLIMKLKMKAIEEKRDILDQQTKTLEEQRVFRTTSADQEQQLQQIQKEIETLHAELDIMESISSFFKTHGALVADELDQDCDPTQEKNFAYGNNLEIDKQKQQACWSLLEAITVSDNPILQELNTRLREEPPPQLDDIAINRYRNALAEHLFSDPAFQRIGTKEDCVTYLTNSDPNKAHEIYLSSIKEHLDDPEYQKIAYTRQFIADILPEALKKRYGISYGFSQDGVSVIVYEESARKKEGWHHSSDMERAWYTAVSYLQKGIRTDQARELVRAAKERAENELQILKRTFPDSNLEDTETAKTFFADLNMQLSTLGEENLESVCQAVYDNRNRLLRYVKEIILPNLRQAEKKIVSNAQDLPHAFGTYSGSSGTDMGKDALPDCIDSSEARQPGVHGEVISHLIQHAQKNPSPLLASHNIEERYSLLASEMKWGDCLSDVGRLFPNMDAKTIAQNLMNQFKIQQKLEAGPYYIVFMDECDRWQMLNDQGSIVPYDPTSDLRKKITLFDPIHTRGAERTSTSGVTEFVSLDVDTEWSRFEQAVLRERGITKGKATVRYILSPQLQEKIGKKPSFQTIMEYLLQNEAIRLKKINYKATRQRITHIVKRTGEKALRALSEAARREGTQNHHQSRERAFKALENLYFVPQQASADKAAVPHSEQPTKEVLRQLIQAQRDIVSSIQQTLSQNQDEPLQAFLKTMEDAISLLRDQENRLDDDNFLAQLPSSVSSSPLELDMEEEVEEEQQAEIATETETSQELAYEMQEAKGTQSYPFLPELDVEHRLDYLPIYQRIQDANGRDVSDTFEIHRLRDENRYQPRRKFYTENCYPRARSKGALRPWGFSETGTVILSQKRPISHSLFFVSDSYSPIEIIGSCLDRATFFQNFALKREKKEFIYNYDLRQVEPISPNDRPQEQLDALPPTRARELMRLIVSTMVQRGDVDFPRAKQRDGTAISHFIPTTTQEILQDYYEALLSYLKTIPRQERLTFENGIQAMLQQQCPSVTYEGSDLQKAFKEVSTASETS